MRHSLLIGRAARAGGSGTFGFCALRVLATTFCGKQAGSTHQMPSVSSSSVLPIFSTRTRASLMMPAPVYVTTPAISIEYQRAPRRIT